MSQTTTRKRKPIEHIDKPWFKVYAPGTGPIIGGSELRNTTSSSRRAFKEPEPRP